MIDYSNFPFEDYVIMIRPQTYRYFGVSETIKTSHHETLHDVAAVSIASLGDCQEEHQCSVKACEDRRIS